MTNNNNNLKISSDNIFARLLSKTPEQLKKYCELLDDKKRQDLHEKVLKEMRKNPEINQLKKLNEIAAAINNYHKEGEK